MALQYRYSAANRFGESTSSVDRPVRRLRGARLVPVPLPAGHQRPLPAHARWRRSAASTRSTTTTSTRPTSAAGWSTPGTCCASSTDAPVHHKFLPSSIRTPERVVTNWFPIIKNQTYFAFRHALGAQPEIEVIDRRRANIDRWVADARFHQDAGRLPPGTVDRVLEIGGEAMRRGMELGLERHWTAARADDAARPRRSSASPSIDSSRRRCIAIDHRRLPAALDRRHRPLPRRPRSGARRTRATRSASSRAPSAARHRRPRGRRVGPPVVAAPSRPATAWRQRHSPTSTRSSRRPPPSCSGSATWRTIDVAYGPAWDVDVIAALRTTPVPVVTMLATPVAVAARHAGGPRRSAGRCEPRRADARRGRAVPRGAPRPLDQRRRAGHGRARVRRHDRADRAAVGADRAARPPTGEAGPAPGRDRLGSCSSADSRPARGSTTCSTRSRSSPRITTTSSGRSPAARHARSDQPSHETLFRHRQPVDAVARPRHLPRQRRRRRARRPLRAVPTSSCCRRATSRSGW